jgi:DNA-binding transcriptional LysR family regulator
MARPEPFGERFAVRPIYRESYVVAFPVGHRFQETNAVSLGEIEHEAMLSRLNCEYHDYVGAICRERGLKVNVAYGSEREDWIQSMVTAGLGICLIWESSPIIPGVMTRQIVDPEITREISLVSVAGRRFTPAAMHFSRAAQGFDWRS